MRMFATFAAGALLGFSTVAAAQQPTIQGGQSPVAECLCNVPIEAGSRAATLEDIRGQVLLADTAGYTPIHSRADLSVGDRVVLLKDGQAVLTAGPTCRVALTAGSIVNVDAYEGRACIAQVSQAAAIIPTQAPPDERDPDLFVPVTATLVWGGAIAAIVLLDDDPVSPQ